MYVNELNTYIKIQVVKNMEGDTPKILSYGYVCTDIRVKWSKNKKLELDKCTYIFLSQHETDVIN